MYGKALQFLYSDYFLPLFFLILFLTPKPNGKLIPNVSSIFKHNKTNLVTLKKYDKDFKTVKYGIN